MVDRTPRARPRGRSRPNSRQQRDFRRRPRTGRALTSESRSEHPERNPTRSARAAPRNPLGLSRSLCRLGRADHRRPKIRLGAHDAKEARRSRIHRDTASRYRRRQMGCRADRRPERRSTEPNTPLLVNSCVPHGGASGTLLGVRWAWPNPDGRGPPGDTPPRVGTTEGRRGRNAVDWQRRTDGADRLSLSLEDSSFAPLLIG